MPEDAARPGTEKRFVHKITKSAKRIFMKRKLVAFVLSAAMLVTGMVGCGSDEKPVEGDTGSTREITKVVLNEVAHSIFYAPMYAAIENGYFKEESIDLELVTGFGADKTMTAVLSGEADIGFMGPETTVYACNEGATDLVVNFAQLTQRAGNFLVARAADDAFSWDKLKGKDVLGGRDGGIPSHDVTWEHIRGIYERTSRKAPNLKGFKYEERVIENLG